VTVTLKDAEGNLVSGQASALTSSTVTVPNATQKANSNWVDNGDGTYTGTYVANTVGTGLKASVKLTDWANPVESAGYAITVGDAAQSNSTVVVDNTTYVAGTDITVTVTLKDAEGNLVSGQASALTSSTVTVPNATQKANSNWVDNGDGTYTGIYVANITGTDLKATVKLSDWNNTVISAPYTIEPDVNSANIELTWINSIDLSLSNGTDLNEIEAVIKDANDNVIPGAKFNVSLPNGVLLSGSSNPLTVDNDGILKFNVTSTSFGKMEIKGTVESSGHSSSTTVNFSPVNLMLTVNINN
ncbi:Ig-like domain-containing protein, partial [Providencia rettgeri]